MPDAAATEACRKFPRRTAARLLRTAVFVAGERVTTPSGAVVLDLLYLLYD